MCKCNNENNERYFEVVKDEYRKFFDREIKLPERSTKHSAGYDFFSNEEKILHVGESYVFWTDVKAKMNYDEVLCLYIRSSLAIKYGIELKNQTGIIDCDYYNNKSNDGLIGICLINNGNVNFKINSGDKIAQGIFSKYLLTKNDSFDIGNERVGGIGSTT